MSVKNIWLENRNHIRFIIGFITFIKSTVLNGHPLLINVFIVEISHKSGRKVRF